MDFIKKFWADESKRNGLLFVIMVFVFTFALYAGSTSLGFISTFPIFFVCALVIFLFYRNLKNALLVTALLSLTVSLFSTTGNNSIVEGGGRYMLKFALLIMLFHIIGAWAAYLIAGWVKTKTVGGWIKSAVVAVLYLLCFNYMFGNIFGAVKWHNSVIEHLDKTYPNQKIDSVSTAFNFETQYYESTIIFADPTSKAIGEEKMILQDNYDGYFQYAKARLFEIGRSIMTAAVRESGTKMQFEIDSLPFEDKDIQPSMLDLGGDYTPVLEKLSYEVRINDETASIEEFEEYCKIFTDALTDKVPYNHLELYGGEKKGLIYQAQMRDGVLNVEPFDQAAYVDSHRLGALAQ